jgi:calmodulin
MANSNERLIDGIRESFVAEMKDIFSYFDSEKTGYIKTEDLGALLRGLGKNVTEKQIHQYVNDFDSKGTGEIDFPVFFDIMKNNQHNMKRPATEEEMIDNFAVFDMKKNGEISAEDFVHMLKNLSEPLTDDDVNNLLMEINIDGDLNINIRDFVSHMISTSSCE